MKRVVVTGLGVVSSLGNNATEVTQALREGKSGIEFVPQYKELGFRSQVAGTIRLNPEELIDRQQRHRGHPGTEGGQVGYRVRAPVQGARLSQPGRGHDQAQSRGADRS